MGPPIQLVGSNIGEGNHYTLDQPITLTFDRFLDPTSVTRQAISLEDSSRNIVTDALISYDPVTLTVSVSNPGAGLAWLTAGQQYRVVLNVPSFEGGGPSGLSAIDGATLSAPVTVLFDAGAAANPPVGGTPVLEYCRDIKPIFRNSCAYSGCHVTPQPNGLDALDGGQARLGLDLYDQAGFQRTAVNQVADESNTGPLAAPGSWTNAPFGIDMPIVSPGSPGLSWLMYKVLLEIPTSPADAADVGQGASTFGSSVTPAVSTSERAVLNNYILGQGMPFPYVPDAAVSMANVPATSTLSEGDMVRLSTWIAQGARQDPSCQ